MTSIKLFDTHCHLDYEPLREQVGHYLSVGSSQGIRDILIPATTAARFEQLCPFVAQFSQLKLALGLHPIYLLEHDEEAVQKTEAYVKEHQPIAIGEVGLDYFVETLDRERQQQLFEQMIDIASANQLPLILHVRRSHDPVIATLKRKKFGYGGIVHAFAGSMEQAKQFIKLGFVLGFGGVMTYSCATRVRRLATELELRNIVLETDAPDMAPADWPEPYNTPLALTTNFQALCSLRTESSEEIADITTANAYRVLNLA